MSIPSAQEMLVLTIIEECCPSCRLSLKQSGAPYFFVKETGPNPKVVVAFKCPCGKEAYVVLPPYSSSQLNYEIEWK